MPLVGGYVTEETHLGRYSQIDSRENPLMEVLRQATQAGGIVRYDHRRETLYIAKLMERR